MSRERHSLTQGTCEHAIPELPVPFVYPAHFKFMPDHLAAVPLAVLRRESAQHERMHCFELCFLLALFVLPYALAACAPTENMPYLIPLDKMYMHIEIPPYATVFTRDMKPDDLPYQQHLP